MSLQQAFHELVTLELVLAWVAVSLVSVGVLWFDLRRNNRKLPSMMKLVWTLTVLYSGVLGLAVYWYSGRSQIPDDTFLRRGMRSTAHCYSGCGVGEVLGVTLAAGILLLNTVGVVAVTFTFAYLFGVAFTVGPLMQEGVGIREALADAVYSESGSIVAMETVAIGSDIYLAGEATMGEPVFWASLAVSLSLGFLAAYPINLGLLHLGVKEGMGDPSAM
ncbi:MULTISPECIES: DUF4396 domain-containing protein [Halolamina]|uniref:DUF4396 domain-containing protein n=1 Tax=Halolamina pelagica TaxID=699431 RepID=A0A1I5UEY5_9EURY|nr:MULTISPECIES: DUF4396 domain-containing protein [Halolamina]NHX37250.1 DUF4396 domain-containing protein [Halolamina sp. R1-12]SFP93834.1 protein of unknown function [Halolamina pelagica]